MRVGLPRVLEAYFVSELYLILEGLFTDFRVFTQMGLLFIFLRESVMGIPDRRREKLLVD